MVKAIILYYLSVKATHGYEIQKYIQTTGFEIWAKVKSGSIYYALSKMEKNGEVELVKEEANGSRVRRIYKITDKGRSELEKVINEELSKYLVPIGTEKFIIPMLMNKIDKEKGITIIDKHIKELNETLEYWNYWKDIKINNNSTELEKISFEMNIASIENSIRWHETLKKEYDICVKEADKQYEMIKNVDFSELDEVKEEGTNIDSKKINELKDIILNKPKEAKEAFEELLSLLHNKK
ncbi:PadR family transcriptional regulator [Clostridium gelidum]|uniref:PadR family transcriptional regulator n=1 Tax=Clostridium gelidum TaxID=704125 RepID=A0ABM7TK02_9CLOT|nr:PadR family transcriptional regulator [Clostridium gelidum]BCZ48684.1 PadR family transcriptional regulator [Clostridium gelidum]